jgi:hypothetical protein
MDAWDWVAAGEELEGLRSVSGRVRAGLHVDGPGDHGGHGDDLGVFGEVTDGLGA